MLVPAQHLPISLIGSMWNLGSRWSSPEEEGYVEEESAGECCDIMLGCKAMFMARNTNTRVKTSTQRSICMIHMCNMGVSPHTNTMH